MIVLNQSNIFKTLNTVSNKITLFNSWFLIRQNKYHVDIKWNIYHRYCLFHFLVHSSKTVIHWIIVQDDKNLISSYEPNFFCKKIARVYVLVNLFIWLLMKSCIVTLWKKYTTTIGTITFKKSHAIEVICTRTCPKGLYLKKKTL